MGWIIKLLWVVVALLVALIGFVLAIDNPEPVAVTFLSFTSPGFPVFAWLIAVFIVGLILGFVACFMGFVRGKSTERRLKRELRRANEELESVRAVPLRD